MQSLLRGILALSFVGAWIFSACIGTSTLTTKEAPGRGASISQALPNAEYILDLTSTGTAQLKDGVFEESAAPGSATMTTVRLGAAEATGDVNRDGAEDAATTLVVDPGGSGTFTYLAVVVNQRGKARPVASVLLGDRVVVTSLAIERERVMVTMLIRRPGESMSAEPTVEVTRAYTLQRHGSLWELALSGGR